MALPRTIFTLKWEDSLSLLLNGFNLNQGLWGEASSLAFLALYSASFFSICFLNQSIKNETRKLFHYYLYTEPDLLRTGVKWLIGVSNIMQIEDHVRENKHVIYNCTSYMYMCMINNFFEKGIFSPVKVRIFVRCFSVAIYNMGYSM